MLMFIRRQNNVLYSKISLSIVIRTIQTSFLSFMDNIPVYIILNPKITYKILVIVYESFELWFYQDAYIIKKKIKNNLYKGGYDVNFLYEYKPICF